MGEIENSQHRITIILKSLGIAIELCDISAPGMEEQRDFMRANAVKKEGQRNVLPPQVFNGEKYCGDYDAFDVANEDDELEEFLGIPRKHPKAKPAAEGEAKEGEEAPKPEGEAAPAEGKLLLQQLQRRRLLLPRSREKWDRSSEAAKAIVIPSLCSLLPVSMGQSIC